MGQEPAICYTHIYIHTYNNVCYVAPIKGSEPAGGNKIGGPVGSGDTSLISTVAWPLNAVGYSSMGLQVP